MYVTEYKWSNFKYKNITILFFSSLQLYSNLKN